MAHHHSMVNGEPDGLPKQGPAWTFYVYTVFAILTVIAIVFGFLHAGTLH